MSQPWQKKVDAFRSRFVSRQDIFSIRTAHMVSTTDKVTGEIKLEEKATAMPACSNYGNQNLCLITMKKGGCADCAHRVFKAVTDEEVWKHISGEQEMILFMLREEGIRFGAVDFDKGNVFEDAKAVRDLSVSYGVPCYIAKSTKKGYHVYWFFSDFVEPHEFTSYIRHLYEVLGFYSRWQVNPDIGLPEVFPKQTVFTDKKIGNGIKVPMMEPRMKEGRNCWVDDFEQPIPFDRQWAYLEQTNMTLPSDFRRILKEKNVEILKAPASRSRERARQDEGKEAGQAAKIVPVGNFWNVIEGCPALRERWAKDSDGTYVWDKSHPTGFLDNESYAASMWIALWTTNGEEIVKSRWPDGDTKYHLKYAAEQGYYPISCKTMQDKGICRVGKHPRCGDHCLKRLPPVEYENGKRIVNPDNLPEDKWPDPSPIRYATDRNLSVEEVLERLTDIFKVLKSKSKKTKGKEKEDPELQYFTPVDPQERIYGLWARAIALGEEDYRTIRSHTLQNKWMTDKEIKTLEKNIKKDRTDRRDETLRRNDPTFKFNNSEFFLTNGRYLRVWRDAKGNRLEEELTNFHAIMKEECAVLRLNDNDDLSKITAIEDRTFSGTIYVDNEQFDFNVNYREWMTSSDTFFRTLAQIAGSRLMYQRCNYDHIRNCINAFSKEHCVTRKVSRQIGHHILKGRAVYMMPSVLVDKDSVRQNDEFVIEPFRDEVAKGLDFKVISEEEFKDLALHIVTDLFGCNNAILTMTTFAHAMAAAILPQISAAVGYNKSPILWMAGAQGGGKSFVGEACQHFFGNFATIQGAGGTAKSKLGQGYNFRHAFMLIDDYKKGIVDPFNKEFPALLQTAYDRSGRTALQRDGRLRDRVDRIRGLLAITGEDIVENQASSLSRTILIDVKYEAQMEQGHRVAERKKDYCGFTPYFIKFCLSLADDEFRSLWTHYFEEFHNPIKEAFKKSNPHRVCENLTLNMVAFHLAAEMMAAYGAIPDVHKENLIRIHFDNLKLVRGKIFESVMGATGARVYLEGLKELLSNPAKFMIHNWPEYSGDWSSSHSQAIGFWREQTPDVVYIYPQASHGYVSELLRKNGSTMQSLNHVARDLFEEGQLATELLKEKGGFVVAVRGPNKNTIRAWPLRLSAIGFDMPKPRGGKKPWGSNESGGQGEVPNVVSMGKKS